MSCFRFKFLAQEIVLCSSSFGLCTYCTSSNHRSCTIILRFITCRARYCINYGYYKPSLWFWLIVGLWSSQKSLVLHVAELWFINKTLRHSLNSGQLREQHLIHLLRVPFCTTLQITCLLFSFSPSSLIISPVPSPVPPLYTTECW